MHVARLRSLVGVGPRATPYGDAGQRHWRAAARDAGTDAALTSAMAETVDIERRRQAAVGGCGEWRRHCGAASGRRDIETSSRNADRAGRGAEALGARDDRNAGPAELRILAP